MSISVHIHSTHRCHTDGKKVVKVKGDNVGNCLRAVAERYPGMRDKLFDDRGELSKLLEVYVNLESAYPDELKKPVKAGDEIYLTLLLAGG